MSNTSLELPRGIKILNNSPLDSKFFNKNNEPYTDVNQVLTELMPETVRHKGLFVYIDGLGLHWFENGTTDGDLVPYMQAEFDKLDFTLDFTEALYLHIICPYSNMKINSIVNVLNAPVVDIAINSIPYVMGDPIPLGHSIEINVDITSAIQLKITK